MKKLTLAMTMMAFVAVTLAGGRDGGKKKRDGQDKEEDVAMTQVKAASLTSLV